MGILMHYKYITFLPSLPCAMILYRMLSLLKFTLIYTTLSYSIECMLHLLFCTALLCIYFYIYIPLCVLKDMCMYKVHFHVSIGAIFVSLPFYW